MWWNGEQGSLAFLRDESRSSLQGFVPMEHVPFAAWRSSVGPIGSVGLPCPLVQLLGLWRAFGKAFGKAASFYRSEGADYVLNLTGALNDKSRWQVAGGKWQMRYGKVLIVVLVRRGGQRE